jgi:hypothetical protein
MHVRGAIYATSFVLGTNTALEDTIKQLEDANSEMTPTLSFELLDRILECCILVLEIAKLRVGVLGVRTLSNSCQCITKGLCRLSVL